MREHSCGMNEGMLAWSEWRSICVEWVRGRLCEVNEWTLMWGSPQTWEYVCHFITFLWSTCKEQDPGYIHSDCSWDVSGGTDEQSEEPRVLLRLRGWDCGTGCGKSWALAEGNEPLLHKVQHSACLQVSSSRRHRCLTWSETWCAWSMCLIFRETS